MAHAAFLVADLVERQKDLFGEFRAFLQNGFDDIGRRVGKAGKVVVSLVTEHVVEDEQRVFDRGLIAWHWGSLVWSEVSGND